MQVARFFTEAQREQFTRFPDLDERLLSRHDLLDAADLALSPVTLVSRG